MTNTLAEDVLIKRYLLGELDEQEQKRVERQYFDDDDYFARVLAAEENLIEGYKRKTLTEHERARFETHYLSSPRRRQRVELHGALRKVVPPPNGDPGPDAESVEDKPAGKTWRQTLRELFDRRMVLTAAAAALVLVVVAGLWLNYRRSQPAAPEAASSNRGTHTVEPSSPTPLSPQLPSGPQVGPSPAQSPPVEQAGAHQNLARRQPKPAPERRRANAPDVPERAGAGTPSLVASVTIIPNSFRTTVGPDTLVIRPSNSTVRLNIFVDDQRGEAFDVTLWPDNRRGDAQTWNALKPQATSTGLVIPLQLPAQQLSEGAYTLTLQSAGKDGGRRKAGEYSFEVKRP